MAMEAHSESGDKPFRILAAAFIDPVASQGLTLEHLMGGVMQNFRPEVDELASSLTNGMGATFGQTPIRRFRHMLTMLEAVGAIAAKDTKYIAWNTAILTRLARTGAKIGANISCLIDQFALDCADSCLATTRMAPLRITASCISKRFLILTGLAGSGKTKLAQAFAHWISPPRENDSETNVFYSIVPVGADWSGNEHILGYPDGLQPTHYVAKPALDLILHAEVHDKVPHFLILDEMNLSHVERYFADVLSTIESDEGLELYSGDMKKPETWRSTSAAERVPPKLKQLPENLFIIGTVNVDETTYMFSPKVLDRANVIEFRMDAVELEGFLGNPEKPDLSKLDGKGASFGKAFVDAAKGPVAVPVDVKAAYDAEMLLFFKTLQAHGAEFGYRTAYETARFIHFYKLLGNHADGDATWLPGAFDCVIFQKLLPKLHGSRGKLGPVLKKLWFLCVNDAAGRGADALKAAEEAARSTEKKAEPSVVVPAAAPYPLSAEKIGRMWRLLIENGFASFAEA
jgi:hypothetical protein